MTQTVPALTEPRWRTVARRTLIAVFVLAAFGGFWLAASRTKTGEQSPTITGGGQGGSTVASILSPLDGAQVVNQKPQISIQVDLRYNATLTLIDPARNPTPIPDDQVTKLSQAGGNQLLFTPADDKAVKFLPAGKNCVRADLFRIDGTPELVNPVEWCFTIV